MKKLYTLLFLCLPVFAMVTKAQIPTSCNGQFTFNVTGNTASFVSVNAGPTYFHSWSFGDGTTSALANPVHTFTNCGTYTVFHFIEARNPNGVTICADSSVMTLTIACNTPCNAVANFSASNLNNQTNVFLFTNTSTAAPNSAVNCFWSFGDGTSASAQFISNQTHTYANSGIYNVCLVLTSGTPGTTNVCRDTFCSSVQVQVNPTPCNIVPSFSAIASPNQNNVYTFTNTSTGSTAPATITWNFGDSSTGTGTLLSHTFTQPGTYNVCMHIASSNTCFADTCRTITIAPTPAPCNMIAGFTATATSAVNTYQFTNTSTGFAAGDSIRWTFGDGTSAYDLNPSHTYAAPGTYQVCLYLRKNNTPAGSTPCVASLCYGVVVGSPCNLHAAFTNTPGNQANTIIFTNTSITANAPAVTWNFGDSTTGNGSIITHTYASPGTYLVCMHVAVNNTCYADTCITVTVNGSNPQPCNLNANFNWQASPASPNVFYFMNATTGFTPGDSIRWNFGDGTVGFMLNPVHTYTQPGTYNVCIRIAKTVAPGTPPCVSEICRTITVSSTPGSVCDSIQTTFTFAHDYYVPNKIYFYTISNMPVNQEHWTITPLNNTGGVVTLNQYNPAFVFSATGDYLVCLNATTINGCVKNYCDTVNISAIASQCMLAAYPNPASAQVSVNAVLSAPSNIYAYLFNSQNILLNQRVQAGITGNNVMTFNTSNLPAGYYTIRLYYNNQVCVARFQKL